MNTLEFVQCSKNDVRVRSMFDKMVFDPSLDSKNQSVEILGFFYHSDFTRNQFWGFFKDKICHLAHLEALNFDFMYFCTF